MSVRRRLALYSGMRFDVPHFRSLESSIAHDFDDLTRGLFTGLNRPYLIRGFKVKIPTAAINASSLQIEVADSAILHASATESGTILLVPSDATDQTLDSANTKVIGSFQAGVPNYISLDYRRTTDTSTIDQTAGWSASQQIEYQRSVPIGRILDYRFVISTSGFSTNLPLYIVYTNSLGAVTHITKAVPSLFRKASGGANPDPFANYNFNGLINSQTGDVREWISTDTSVTPNPVTVKPGDPVNAFEYGDFGIHNMRDWMQAVMTRFCQVTGSPYWYLDGAMPLGGINLNNLWFDSVGHVLTGGGSLSYNLILEALVASLGRFQSPLNDLSILPGDSYVQGLTSGTKATISSVNGTQLIINSLTTAGFTYGETLWNRRKFRPTSTKFSLTEESLSPYRYGVLKRIPSTSGAYTAISSWSYSNIQSQTNGLEMSVITVDTSAPHGLSVGNLVEVLGLQAGTSVAPNGTAVIKTVPSATQFTFYHPSAQAGAATVLLTNGVRLDNQDITPYVPRFSISSWSYVGSAITLVVPGHNFLAPILTTADTSLGSYNLINLPSTDGLKIGQAVAGAGISAGSVITKILSATSVEISQAATANGTATAVTFTSKIHVTGLTSTTNSPNGVWEVSSLGPGVDAVNFTALATPTGTAGVSSAIAMPDIHTLAGFNINGATPTEFNINDTQAIALDPAHLEFILGSDALPTLGVASGSYTCDGVVAESVVLDPVRISGITNPLANVIEITTTVSHGLVTTPGPLTFTIYGDSSNSQYIRTYSNVSIQYISPTVFRLTGSGVPFNSQPAYTNPLNAHNTFAKFSDNPYAGPILWDRDMVIKSIIGDTRFVIPQTAIAYTTSEDANVSPLANKFNTGSQTGTLYLQDGEVAYVILERGKSVSSGATYSTAGGASNITGSTAPLDENAQPLVAGDFVRFEGEGDHRWVRLAGTPGTPIVSNSFSLVSDNGQSPTTTQRPAASGKLQYFKGIYSKVFVKKHYLVDPTADVYWMAVRRDNQAQNSKVYFRGLELEAGEVRQVNDNQTSNLLSYVGAPNEGAVNPNYSVKDTAGDYQYMATLEVGALDNQTRMVSFTDAPAKGFQKGDRIVKGIAPSAIYLTVKQPISNRTVIVVEDISGLSVSDPVVLHRENKNVSDQDNLTLAIRKEDRELGAIQTAMERPVYDESVFVQQINLGGAGTVRSGSYIYKGPQYNPTALAWVLHGNVSVVETIESAAVSMPGGHSSIGANAILVHIISGTFSDGDGLYQNGALTGRTVNNPGNPPFTAPSVYGDTIGGGVELVLPPNKRTQVVGSEYIAFGNHSYYKASTDVALAGEELLVIANQTIRSVPTDYEEIFGGPKAKIRLRDTLPPNTTIRFRVVASFGSVLAAKAADTTLQSAYNGGATIQTLIGRPVEITSNDVNGGAEGLINRGSMLLNGGTSALGGIFNETTDKSFVIGSETDKPKESWTALDGVKQHDTHPGSGWIRKTAAQVVTGDTGTIITGSAIPLSDLHSYRIKMSAVARRSDGTFGTAAFSLEGNFYRNGGAAAAAGSPLSQVLGADGDGVSYAVAFGLSGNDVVAVVYGTVGATVQWALSIEYQAVGAAT